MVGSVTEKVTTGNWPGAVLATDSTLNWNFLPASTVGMTCATAVRQRPPPAVAFGPWQSSQDVSSGKPPAGWPSPVRKFTSLWWQVPQDSEFTTRRQLLASGVSASDSSWQVWQLRRSWVQWISE